ncbi:hypothetical protein F4678DRAFT_254272 [Xylaria arbuscula]|nr:hypothetical protein F4678DRAFT_254272 [Xylaria arbuscula]
MNDIVQLVNARLVQYFVLFPHIIPSRSSLRLHTPISLQLDIIERKLVVLFNRIFTLYYTTMLQTRDGLKNGKLVINVTMVLWLCLVIIAWSSMGYQIYRGGKKEMGRSPDLEAGTAAVEDNVPLGDVLKKKEQANKQPKRKTKSSFGSWPPSSNPSSSKLQSSKSGTPKDSEWYYEGRPLRQFLQKVFSGDKKDKAVAVKA